MLQKDQQEKLKDMIHEVEGLDERRSLIGQSISLVYKRARSHGLDVPAMKRVIQLRKMGAGATAHLEMCDLYLTEIERTPIEEAIDKAKAEAEAGPVETAADEQETSEPPPPICLIEAPKLYRDGSCSQCGEVRMSAVRTDGVYGGWCIDCIMEDKRKAFEAKGAFDAEFSDPEAEGVEADIDARAPAEPKERGPEFRVAEDGADAEKRSTGSHGPANGHSDGEQKRPRAGGRRRTRPAAGSEAAPPV